MKVDIERITGYLLEIKNRVKEIEELLSSHSDEDLLKNKWLIKGLKYSLVEIAEAIANTLTHILAKDRGVMVSGYIDTVIKSKENRIISEDLYNKIKPFMDFRNSLIHRYWVISDNKLLELTRKNYKDFENFIREIENYIKSIKN